MSIPPEIRSEILLRKRCVVFDLDGTLCDTLADVHAALSEALRNQGIALVDPDRIRIGPPISEMIRAATGSDLDDTAVASIAAEYRRLYNQSDYAGSPLYPGISELLERLRNLGRYRAVATLKSETSTLRLLEKKGIVNQFDAILCNDSRGEKWTKKRMLEEILATAAVPVEQTLFFGDSVGDILAGRALGTTTVAALYGYGIPAELVAAEPDYVCHSIAELAAR